MTIMSFRLGTNDVARARTFYNATLAALDEGIAPAPEGAPVALYRLPNGPVLIIGKAADGEPATHANGGTTLFIAKDRAGVDAWYRAGMANGGTCEGEPGPRAQVRGKYGAYLRDPDGNKLGAYVGNLFGG